MTRSIRKSKKNKKKTQYFQYRCKELTNRSPTISVFHRKRKIRRLSVQSRRIKNGRERACIWVRYSRGKPKTA